MTLEKKSVYLSSITFLKFYPYIYPPDSKESDGGANTWDKQLPRRGFGDAKILLSGWNFVEIWQKFRTACKHHQVVFPIPNDTTE